MVEGPGCKLKGEKMKSRLIGQTVKKVSGNAVSRELKNRRKKTEGDSAETSFHRLVGRRLEDVCTLGKELFMIFGDSCIRVHFLMAGSFRVNGQQLDQDRSSIANTASLEVTFNRDTMTLYKCAAEVRSSESCLQRYQELHELDICSPVFNHKRAVAMAMSQAGRQVCDVLLDQTVLPGVGNIIKNEALYDSGIKPDTKMEELKEEHISHLIKMTRDFSLLFYKCRKTGASLEKHMKVYRRGRCRECQGKITMCRLGEDNGRVTYFCAQCQTNSLKAASMKLPSRNSLLGWLQPGGGKGGGAVEGREEGDARTDGSARDWSCQQCTLLNDSLRNTCSVCLAPRQSDSTVSKRLLNQTTSSSSDREVETVDLTESDSEAISDIPAKKPRLELLTFQEPSACGTRGRQNTRSRTTSLGGPASNLSTSNLSTPLRRSTRSCFVPALKSGISSPPLVPSQTLVASSPLPQGLSGSESLTSTRQKRQSMGGGPSSEYSDPCYKIPFCPGHHQRCALKQTHKEGPNKHRWFFTCAARKSTKSCNFFEWADSKFPICPGHGKTAALCTVMKPGANNGKRFFACPKPRKLQCSFFQWAEGFG